MNRKKFCSELLSAWFYHLGLDTRLFEFIKELCLKVETDKEFIDIMQLYYTMRLNYTIR